MSTENCTLRVVPLTINFGEHIYRDGIDLSHKRFFELLIESDELPQTSQVSPFAYEQELSRIPDGDEILLISLSSKLSGTFESALTAIESTGKKVELVDTFSVCVGERILIEQALRLAKQGLSAAAIKAELDELKGSVKVLALLDTLEYLRRGGRVSNLAAGIGTMLSIKPVISVIDGKVELVGKARGSKNGKNLLTEFIERAGGIDFDKPFALAYGGLEDSLLRKYIEDSRLLWEDAATDLPIYSVGATIGTHVGPGSIALAFFCRS